MFQILQRKPNSRDATAAQKRDWTQINADKGRFNQVLICGNLRLSASHFFSAFSASLWLISVFLAGAAVTAMAAEHKTFRDPKTGAVIHQLTDHPSINHPTYFLNSSFTPDGKVVILTSYRSGSPQLYEKEYPDGTIRQLTSGDAIQAFSAVMGRDGKEVFFVRKGGIYALERATRRERRLAEFPGGQLGECSLSPDGRWLTAALKDAQGSGVVLAATNGSDWRVVTRFPRTIIHPQFHPLEPEWIEFSGDPAPRMHRVRRDGSGLECLYQHSNDEFIVHETFLGSTGDLVFVVWPFALKRMDWKTRRISTIAGFNAWHITPNRDGAMVLCDTNHPDIGIQLIDARTGKRRTICYPQSSNGGTQWRTSRYAVAEDWAAAAQQQEKSKALSWMEMATDRVYGPQWTHPHPSFSPDERKIIYASDVSGHTQVYVAEIPVQK